MDKNKTNWFELIDHIDRVLDRSMGLDKDIDDEDFDLMELQKIPIRPQYVDYEKLVGRYYLKRAQLREDKTKIIFSLIFFKRVNDISPYGGINWRNKNRFKEVLDAKKDILFRLVEKFDIQMGQFLVREGLVHVSGNLSKHKRYTELGENFDFHVKNFIFEESLDLVSIKPYPWGGTINWEHLKIQTKDEKKIIELILSAEPKLTLENFHPLDINTLVEYIFSKKKDSIDVETFSLINGVMVKKATHTQDIDVEIVNDVLLPILNPTINDVIYDAACGDGTILALTADHILRQENTFEPSRMKLMGDTDFQEGSCRFIGGAPVDYSFLSELARARFNIPNFPNAFNLIVNSKKNILPSSNPSSFIDLMTEELFVPNFKKKPDVSFIIPFTSFNIPYPLADRFPSTSKLKDFENKKIFNLTLPNYLDYRHWLDLLEESNKNGRLALVIPHGELFTGGNGEKYRKILTEEKDYLEAIIQLPYGFSTSHYDLSDPKVVVILNKNKSKNKKHKYLFGNLPKDSSGNRNLDKDAISSFITAYETSKVNDKFDHCEYIASLDEIQFNNYDLRPLLYLGGLTKYKTSLINEKNGKYLKELCSIFYSNYEPPKKSYPSLLGADKTLPIINTKDLSGDLFEPYFAPKLNSSYPLGLPLNGIENGVIDKKCILLSFTQNISHPGATIFDPQHIQNQIDKRFKNIRFDEMLKVADDPKSNTITKDEFSNVLYQLNIKKGKSDSAIELDWDRDFEDLYELARKQKLTLSQVKSVLLRETNKYEKIIITSKLVALRIKKNWIEKLDLLYLHSLFCQPIVWRQFKSSLTTKDIEDIVIPVPPTIDEQKSVVYQHKERAISELKKKQEDFRSKVQLEKEKIELNIIENLAHCLNGPIGELKLLVERIQDIFKGKPEENQPFFPGKLETTKDKLGHMLLLLDQMDESLSQTENVVTLNIKESEYKHYDIEKLFSDEIKPLYIDRNFEFNLEVNLKNKNCFIHHQSFVEAMTNLITNAIRYGFQRDSFKNALGFEFSEDEDYIILNFWNNGKPMEISSKEYIKDRFTTDSIKGSGKGGNQVSKMLILHGADKEPEFIHSNETHHNVHMRFKFPIERIRNGSFN